MKVWIVSETDGYDGFAIQAVYDNEEAAELHSMAIDDANPAPQPDYGLVLEFEVQSEYQLPERPS